MRYKESVQRQKREKNNNNMYSLDRGHVIVAAVEPWTAFNERPYHLSTHRNLRIKGDVQAVIGGGITRQSTTTSIQSFLVREQIRPG